MYGIRFEKDSLSALTDLVFHSKEKAQEYIDSENETRVRLGLYPGVFVLQKLIVMDELIPVRN